MIPQVELFSFIFWKNSKHKKDISKLIDLYQPITWYISSNWVSRTLCNGTDAGWMGSARPKQRLRRLYVSSEKTDRGTVESGLVFDQEFNAQY